MTSLVLALAVIAAVATVAMRRMGVSRRRRTVGEGPGSSPGRSIRVRSFDEIDATLGERTCPCGGSYELAGEGTREVSGRRYRVSRLTCEACEVEQVVFFDTTELLQ